MGGVESARFRVKQPSTDGLRVVFKPGPVAPGMLARLEVEFALPGDTSLLGEVLDEVVITTEADVFHVPISARVVTFEEARALFYSSGKQTIAAPGVKRVPVRRSGPPGPSTPSSKRGAQNYKDQSQSQKVLPVSPALSDQAPGPQHFRAKPPATSSLSLPLWRACG